MAAGVCCTRLTARERCSSNGRRSFGPERFRQDGDADDLQPYIQHLEHSYFKDTRSLKVNFKDRPARPLPYRITERPYVAVGTSLRLCRSSAWCKWAFSRWQIASPACPRWVLSIALVWTIAQKDSGYCQPETPGSPRHSSSRTGTRQSGCAGLLQDLGPSYRDRTAGPSIRSTSVKTAPTPRDRGTLLRAC